MSLNEFDLISLQRTLAREACPNALGAALVVAHLADWTNANSDGWAYWPKPQRAAKSLTDRLYRDHLGRYDERSNVDLTDAELTALVKPIKAFLTRQGVSAERREVILRGAEVLR